MDSAELGTLKDQLGALRPKPKMITDLLKSERDPVKIDNYKLSLKSLQNLERLLLAKIAQYHLRCEVTRLKGELSSSAPDSARQVELIERLEAASVDMAALDAEILQCDREIRESPRIELPDEILKKLAAESVQMSNRAPMSAASPAQSAANKAATEPTMASELAQQSTRQVDEVAAVPQAKHLKRIGQWRMPKYRTKLKHVIWVAWEKNPAASYRDICRAVDEQDVTIIDEEDIPWPSQDGKRGLEARLDGPDGSNVEAYLGKIKSQCLKNR